jgi:dinuclear metal center YbgI/SA1388 family protein
VSELTTAKFDAFIKGFLDIEGFTSADNSMNGIQVDNDGSPVRKIAFAVDAAMETFEKAGAMNAGILFVHHGLFWGKSLRVAGVFRRRIKFLLDHNICLYGVHLPLDQHSQFGNNGVLANLLGLENIESFGDFNPKVGYKGTLSKPITIDEAEKKISFMGKPPLGVYPFGKKENTTIAITSGGAPTVAREAIAQGIDLFVTGESSHGIYHECLEAKMNLLCGGHYSTEVWGVRAVMEHCKKELGIDVEFIDAPTGL